MSNFKKTFSSSSSYFLSVIPSGVSDIVKGFNAEIMGRERDEEEIKSIEIYQQKLNQEYREEDHLPILQGIWEGCHLEGTFELVSPQWKEIGFQNEDPSKDVRGGGELFLTCLCYFIEIHPDLSTPLMESRRNRDDGINYPFCAAGNQVMMMVAQLFNLHLPSSSSSKNYWYLTKEDDWFEELFSFSFLLVDKFFEENGGTYMDFPMALEDAKHRFFF